MPRFHSPLFLIILVTYLAAGVLYAVLTPRWQAPDEPAHYNYVRALVRQPGFPELTPRCYNQAYLEELLARRFPPDLSLDNLCYEFYQPPLYYLLATPAYIVGRGALLGLRLFSVMLGAGVVTLAFAISRTIFPQSRTIVFGTMAFVAFVPMHVAILASVNNDALAELIVAGILLLLVRRLVRTEAASAQQDILLGLFLGLGLLTKLTVYVVAIPLIAVALWWTAGGRPLSGLLRQVLLVYGLALLLALPWYIRNATIYGDFDILGLVRHDQVVIGQLRTTDLLAQVGGVTYLGNFFLTTFRSFWGQFGWMAVPMDPRLYLVLALLTLIALAGLAAFLEENFRQQSSPLSPGQRRALALLALAVLLLALAYAGYNLSLVQFQGRYLFPALIPIGLLFTLGLHAAFAPQRRWWLAGLLVLAVAGVLAVSLLAADLYRWALLITGLLAVLAVARAWLVSYWSVPPAWLLVACYLALAGLTLLSPYRFIVAHLSP